MSFHSKLSDYQYFSFLTIIENDGSLIDMLALELDYKELTLLLNNEIEHGTVHFEGAKISLTDKGQEIKEKLKKALQIVNAEHFITSLSSTILPKTSDYTDIFIPDQNEIDF